MSASERAELAKIVAEWRKDPHLFVTEALGANPYLWQKQVHRWLADGEPRISVRSGHGVGKTAEESWQILWFPLTRFDAKVGITAPAAPQLEVNLWPELRKWHRIMANRSAVGRWLAEQMTITELHATCSNGNIVTARTARPDQPEALQGLHAENILFLIEEASGVPEAVFEVAMGSLSSPGAIQCLFGNPTRLSGYFFDSHHTLRHKFKTMRVSSDEIEGARGHIDDVITKYGKDSNAYKIRVLGEFPTTEDDSVISLSLVEAAVTRKIEPIKTFAPVWGVDVARFGDDRTALAKRQCNRLLEPIQFKRSYDLMQTAGWIKNQWDETAYDERPGEILVDVIGIGAGVVDRLRELGLPVRGINVGEAASSNDRYMRFRDELWFKGREWFDAKDCMIPNDSALIAELTAPKYTFTSSGKIVVEPKDEMKERGLPSPDLADAFLLTLAGGYHKAVPVDKYRAYRGKRRQPQAKSWQAA